MIQVETLSPLSSTAERLYEAHKKASRKWYHEHKAVVQQRMVEYYKSNKEKLSVYKKNYYRDRVLAGTVARKKTM